MRGVAASSSFTEVVVEAEAYSVPDLGAILRARVWRASGVVLCLKYRTIFKTHYAARRELDKLQLCMYRSKTLDHGPRVCVAVACLNSCRGPVWSSVRRLLRTGTCFTFGSASPSTPHPSLVQFIDLSIVCLCNASGQVFSPFNTFAFKAGCNFIRSRRLFCGFVLGEHGGDNKHEGVQYLDGMLPFAFLLGGGRTVVSCLMCVLGLSSLLRGSAKTFWGQGVYRARLGPPVVSQVA